jgi:hypothetical protein
LRNLINSKRKKIFFFSFFLFFLKREILRVKSSQALWLMSVIPGTWEVKTRKIMVRGQFGQKVNETLSQPIAGLKPVIPATQET